jgi:hypothetical protein
LRGASTIGSLHGAVAMAQRHARWRRRSASVGEGRRGRRGTAWWAGSGARWPMGRGKKKKKEKKKSISNLISSFRKIIKENLVAEIIEIFPKNCRKFRNARMGI